jgi:putative protein-disulfide isomerase
MLQDTRLYYFHDPMCSWCWAFRPALRQIENRLPEGITLIRVLGGLAPDTDEPMPMAMRARLQEIWQSIKKKVPGTEFNFTYWDVCTPRRSTYRACRAVIAAARQGDHEGAMIEAIQRAYYLEARNPSDRSTLIALAGEIGLDITKFASNLDDPGTQADLDKHLELCRKLGVKGFPTLLLVAGGRWRYLAIDYVDPGIIVKQLLEH